MDARRFPLRQMALRAFDLSEQGVRAGAASQRRRVERWRNRLWMICQCAFTAGLSWWVCARFLHHPQPALAPVAAVVMLGFSFGQRLSRAVEIAVGVALGVFFGDVFVALFGTGPWKITVVCLLAMSVATWLGARNLMIIQAGLQAIIVLTLMPQPGQGVDRWLDAVVGIALALVVTTVAPSSSVSRPRLIAAEVLNEAAETLARISEALESGDPELGDEMLNRARRSEEVLGRLSEASDEGLAVVRYSPFLRSQLPHMQDIAELVVPLDRMMRNLRVLARRSTIALWGGEEIPRSYRILISALADEMRYCAGELQARRIPEAARPRLVALGKESSHLQLAHSLSSVVMLAQVRSMLVDLLALTGLDYGDAREMIPDMD
ncbi:aromatic acid exporter family protein [Mariniluteicoccus endophyticus]